MKTILLGAWAIWIASVVVANADDEARPAPAAGAAIDTHPWNPDLHHGNDWPYARPLVIDTPFVGPPGDFWVRAEYLLWDLARDDVAPLVTGERTGAAPLSGTLIAGAPDDQGLFSGGRFAAGVWFNVDYTIGLEGTYFFLAEQTATFTAASLGQTGSPVLARPFVNILSGQPALRLLAAPGRAAGFATVQSSTQLQGAEATVVWNLYRKPALALDLLPGFRYLNLGRELTIADGTIGLAGAPVVGLASATVDQFAANNRFFGGQFGARTTYRWHSLLVDLTAKVALGGNTADVGIGGHTASRLPQGKLTEALGGLLTQPGYGGPQADDAFAVVNEVGIRAGWQLCDYLQLFAGYTFLYTSSVIQPGNLVDLGVIPSAGTVSTAPPLFVSSDTDFWAHGLNLGLELRY